MDVARALTITIIIRLEHDSWRARRMNAGDILESAEREFFGEPIPTCAPAPNLSKRAQQGEDKVN